MQQLLSFLTRLEAARISYRLEHNREEAIMVLVAIPGQRWEIEFMSDGTVEIEVFIAEGRMRSSDALEELFRG